EDILPANLLRRWLVVGDRGLVRSAGARSLATVGAWLLVVAENLGGDRVTEWNDNGRALRGHGQPRRVTQVADATVLTLCLEVETETRLGKEVVNLLSQPCP